MSAVELPTPSAMLPAGPTAKGSFFVSGSVHRPYALGQKITIEDIEEEMEDAPLTIGRKFGGSGARKSGAAGLGPGSGVRSSISLVELVESGILAPGPSKISCTYKGHSVTATLTASGCIEHQGRQYQSATSFSINFKRTITPSKQGDDGWKSVLYDGKPLEHYRKVYQEIKGSQGGSQSGIAGALSVPEPTAADNDDAGESKEGSQSNRRLRSGGRGRGGTASNKRGRGRRRTRAFRDEDSEAEVEDEEDDFDDFD